MQLNPRAFDRHRKRLILITGVTKGIGRALAKEFARLGHTVIGCARSSEAVEELQRQLGPPHAFDTVDITSDSAVAGWAKRIIDSHGPPELLINNAGRAHKRVPIWEVEASEVDDVINVNLVGAINVLRHFVPAMIKQSCGIIVNISSSWGRTWQQGLGVYSASKWAIEGLTQTLALELPDGMAAVAFNPGVIQTDLRQNTWGDESWVDELVKYPTPDEWARYNAMWLLVIQPYDTGRSLDGFVSYSERHGEASGHHRVPDAIKERVRELWKIMRTQGVDDFDPSI